MIDASEIRSAGWWLQRLLSKLAHGRARYDLLQTYLDNEQPIPIHASKAVRLAYRQLMEISRTNFAELIVEALRERVRPVGFRTGAAGDDLGDKEAWRIWQANSLDADSALVHRSTFALADSHVIVGPVDPEIAAPVITPEDPRQVVVECDPAQHRKIIAALKLFCDDVAGCTRAYLYLPGEVWHATTTVEASPTEVTYFDWDSDAPDMLPAPIVPVVPFSNRSDLFGASTGEFERHTGLLDRINYTLLNRIEIATLQAFKQRAIKGAPVKDAAGNDVDYDDIFEADPGALWVLPQTAEIWESGAVDLGPLRQAIRDDVQDLAAVTRTPLYYLTAEATNGSAEGASLAREGLVFKAEDRQVTLGESWERVMSLAFLFAGDEQRAALPDLEIMWASAERSSLASRADAAAKFVLAGVPWRTVMRKVLEFSPQEITRMEAERAQDLLLNPVPEVVKPTAVHNVPAG